MFNFFKKKPKYKEISKEEIDFFQFVVGKLPEKYQYLYEQINIDFWIGKNINNTGKSGTYGFVLNNKLVNKYSILNQELFIIQNIKCFDAEIECNLELIVLDGLIIGYYFPIEVLLFDLKKIDSTQVYEKYFRNQDHIELKLILNELDFSIRERLEISTSFKIELQDLVLYTVKDLGDGSYLTIDKNKKFYLLDHDPFQIKLVSELDYLLS